MKDTGMTGLASAWTMKPMNAPSAWSNHSDFDKKESVGRDSPHLRLHHDPGAELSSRPQQEVGHLRFWPQSDQGRAINQVRQSGSRQAIKADNRLPISDILCHRPLQAHSTIPPPASLGAALHMINAGQIVYIDTLSDTECLDGQWRGRIFLSGQISPGDDCPW